ncbi:hypothetical protein [Falsiruegeria mediterranea]
MTDRRWPSTIPFDLRNRIDGLAERRGNMLSADVWTEIREWLERHGVDAPDHHLPASDPSMKQT